MENLLSTVTTQESLSQTNKQQRICLVLVQPRKAYLKQTNSRESAYYWFNPGKLISNKETVENTLSSGITQESLSQTNKQWRICLVLVHPRKAYLKQRSIRESTYFWYNPGKLISNKQTAENLLSTGSTQESLSQTKKLRRIHLVLVQPRNLKRHFIILIVPLISQYILPVTIFDNSPKAS